MVSGESLAEKRNRHMTLAARSQVPREGRRMGEMDGADTEIRTQDLLFTKSEGPRCLHFLHPMAPKGA
jgi:hypothetical protein